MDVTLWQKIAAQTVSDVARINLIVLLLGCCNLMQQQRVSYLDLLCMGEEVVVDPASEDRRFHRYHPWLRQSPHLAVQLSPSRSKLAFLLDLPTDILHAVADRLLVYIQSDVIHMSSRSLCDCS